jgi:hypothetical protein
LDGAPIRVHFALPEVRERGGVGHHHGRDADVVMTGLKIPDTRLIEVNDGLVCMPEAAGIAERGRSRDAQAG